MLRMSLPASGRHACQRGSRGEKGQATLLLALMVTAMLGLAAASVDGGNLYLNRRHMQSGADLAALAGAQRLYDGSDADAIGEARVYAAANGYPTATVNVPPVSGNHAGEAEYVEVTISQSLSTFFGGIFGVNQVTVNARAVARSGLDTPPYAMLALSTTDSPAIDFSGSGVVKIKNAGFMSNSPLSPSIKQSTASGWVDSDGPVNAAGTIVGTYTAPVIRGGVPPYPDPLEDMPPPTFGYLGSDAPITRHGSQNHPSTLTVPASGGPLPGSVTAGQADDYTFGPGVYWGGIHISGGSYRMAPGIYVMAGGGLQMSGGALVGDGIFIYNTNDPKPGGGNYGGATGDYGPINLATNQGVELKASHVPLYDGMAANVLIYQDENSTDAADSMGIQATGSTNLYGTIYLPGVGIDIAGGGSSGVAHGQIIAHTISFGGGSAAGVEYDPNWAVVTPGGTLVE